MKIITWNVNGLRSIIRKNCLEQIFELNPDIICFQETKLSDDSVFDQNIPSNYNVFNHLSNKKGQSGVCIISKLPVKFISSAIGHKRFDSEGRYLCVNLENDWSIINLYMPHGKRDKTDIPYKLEIANLLLDMFKLKKNEKIIVCTDFNIAHKEIDLTRASGNRDNAMFTEEERAVIDNLLRSGFIDAFRKFNNEAGFYSWWPYSFQARERNLGWRIDYFFVVKKCQNRIIDVNIRKDILGSDHCPIVMDIDV